MGELAAALAPEIEHWKMRIHVLRQRMLLMVQLRSFSRMFLALAMAPFGLIGVVVLVALVVAVRDRREVEVTPPA